MNRWIKRILSCQYMVDEKNAAGPLRQAGKFTAKRFKPHGPPRWSLRSLH